MFNLEKSIAQWLKQFYKHRAYDQGSVQEMELHLRDHIEDLMKEGYTEKAAFDDAVASFGEVPTMAKEEFRNQQRKTSIQSILFTMLLNNYFKTSFRSMMRNPLSSFVNLFGLSIAIGVCILAYAFTVFGNRIDQFHENRDSVFLTTFFADRDGEEQQIGVTPIPLGQMIAKDLPQIINVCRILDKSAIVKSGDFVFHEQIRYVDPSFLKMLTFPLKWGLASSLEDVNSVILSEDMSIKYFGKVNPLGEEVQLIFDDSRKKTFKVTGVLKDFPAASSIGFNFLINFSNLDFSHPNFDQHDWDNMVSGTLVQVTDPKMIDDVAQQMDKYVSLQNEKQSDWVVSSFGFESIATLYQNSGSIREDISNDGYGIVEFSKKAFMIICIFLVSLASANYINIAIVTASKRLKEIGLRKVIGANRRMLTFQFLSENVFMMVFALGIGLFLGVKVFIPWLEKSSSFEMGFTLFDQRLWIFLILILLITGIVSGIYPALYVSKFQVVHIFKGTIKITDKSLLTRIFLGFQLTLACILISTAVMFTQNSTYQANRDWGFDHKSVLFTPVQDGNAYEQLHALISQESDVISITGSEHHLGITNATQVVEMPDRDYEVAQHKVEYNYFNTMEIPLKEGRLFEANRQSDYNSVVINETLAKNLELKNPLGVELKMEGVAYKIIGVVKDVHAYSFFTKIQPTAFQLAEPESFKFISFRVEKGSEFTAKEKLEAHWAALFPEIPFEGGFQEDTWGDYYEEINFGEHLLSWSL